ncbi:MAG: apolipoprotein N-acyltransferase [candidate division WOR-3 bacterium]
MRIPRPLLLVFPGLALGFAFAPFPFRFLAFIGLVPLFCLVQSPEFKGDTRRLFLWSWLFGGLAAASHFWWLWFLVVPIEPITRFLLNIGVLLLFAYLGLYTAAFALIVHWLGLWSAFLVWPLLEFVRNLGEIAFPWDLLGYSVTPWVPFIQPAAFGGVYLVSAWLVLVNLLVYRTFFSACPYGHSLVGFRHPSPRFAILLLAAVVGPLVLGTTRLQPNRPWLKVAILQPNISPLDKGDRAARERIYSDLLHLIRAAAESRPDLIICPETATLLDVTNRNNDISRALQVLVDSTRIPLFTGTPLHDDKQGTWHNGACLLEPGADTVRQRYYKMRLVPFSEKIPYSDQLPLLRRLIGTADMGNWDRGKDYTVFQLTTTRSRFATRDSGFASISYEQSVASRFACLICFEAIFPDLARQFTRRGSEMFAVVTNDGWFGRILGAQQHAELAVMRTVENGVSMARSANNGISFVVDPYGRVLKKTRLFTQELLISVVPAPLATTPYRRHGDWFIIACLAGVCAFSVVRVLRRSTLATTGTRN